METIPHPLFDFESYLTLFCSLPFEPFNINKYMYIEEGETRDHHMNEEAAHIRLLCGIFIVLYARMEDTRVKLLKARDFLAQF